LRLVKHIAGTTSPKAALLRKTVIDSFRVNKNETDPAKIHAMKQAAERGMSNYLILERSKTDPKIAAHASQDKFQYDGEDIYRIHKDGKKY
jgi:hypothetical protein